jgi:hypothetical protein
MTTKKTNYFTELDGVNILKYIEKKDKYSYLSWAHAVRELKNRHPEATWTIHEYDGVPYMKTECGYFVKVSVVVNDIEMTQVHPVLDHANRPLSAPNAFHINTSIQRCLAKAIALHGLGLHLYAGEDLPPALKLKPHEVAQLLDGHTTVVKENKGEDLTSEIRHLVKIGKINKTTFHDAMEHYTNT